MKRKATVVAATLLLTVLMFAAQASAVPLSGGFSFGGPFEWVSNVSCVGNTVATCPSVALGTANALDFRTFGGNVPSPGVAGSGLIVDNSGTIAALAPLGLLATIKDFTYTGGGTVNFPVPVILAFETTTGGLTVDLLSITSVVTTCSAGCNNTNAIPSIEIRGTALFHAAGFDDTPGSFQLQGGNITGNFSFAAQNGAAVPEPATLMLLGLGLSGLAVAGRLKKR